MCLRGDTLLLLFFLFIGFGELVYATAFGTHHGVVAVAVDFHFFVAGFAFEQDVFCHMPGQPVPPPPGTEQDLPK